MSELLCVECEGQIEVEDNLLLGEILECPDCGAELEVISTTPVAIELAPEVEEDWGE